MKWRVKVLLFSVIFVISLFIYTRNQRQQFLDKQILPLDAYFCLENGECILLEVADSPNEQKLGLMQRSKLDPLRGMYFPFETPRRVGFWMYKTQFPLDILFVFDSNIVYIEHNASICLELPCPTYTSKGLVDGVIELTAGEANRLDINVGDDVRIEYFKRVQ